MYKLPICISIAVLLPIVIQADDIVVSTAAATQVHSVDPGFKTFTQAALGAPVTRTIDVGSSFTIPVFELYTNESKVNVDEPVPGDLTPLPIIATVTFGDPINAGLTFDGNAR